MNTPPKSFLIRYASDAYSLSSLFVREVLLRRRRGHSPTVLQLPTLESLRAGTRQLLLDQARPSRPPVVPNLVAVRALEWDREWNSMRYHGPKDYLHNRWRNWRRDGHSSKNDGAGGVSAAKSADTRGGDGGEIVGKVGESGAKTARVAFMITSDQRRRLSSELGYDASDIRTFKPIEALLLLENAVSKNDDFRSHLKRLVEENKRMVTKEGSASGESDAGAAEVGNKEEVLETKTTTVSSEDAENLHAKPDVAAALISARGRIPLSPVEEIVSTGDAGGDEKKIAVYAIAERAPSDDAVPAAAVPKIVTSEDSERLAMKPDIAAAYMSTRDDSGAGSTDVSSDDEDGGQPRWYEVVETFHRSRPTTGESPSSEKGGRKGEKEDLVVALFRTEEEAQECVRIKESFRLARGMGEGDEQNQRNLRVRERLSA